MTDRIIDEAYLEAVKQHKAKMVDLLMDYYAAHDDLNEYDMMDFGAVVAIIFAQQVEEKMQVVSTIKGQKYLTVSKALNAEETAQAVALTAIKHAMHNSSVKK